MNPNHNKTGHAVLTAQFLFAAILLVVLHHSREMMHYVADQTLFDLLAPVVFDLALLCAACLIAVLTYRFTGCLRCVATVSGISLLVVILTSASSLLYEAKTGDWLSLQVVLFGMSNAGEVGAMIAKEVTLWQGLVALAALVVVTLSLFFAHHVSKKLLAGICGIGLMSIASASLSQQSPDETTFFSRSVQIGWLHGQSAPWHKSMLLSVMGYGEGHKSRFKLLEPERTYSNPEFVAQSGARPNVVFVVLESTRYSVTSPYATDERFRRVTSNLQMLADDGLVVEQAYTTVPHTSKALVGIFCGQFPRKELDILEAEPGGISYNCLPRILDQAGYQTAFFQSAIGTYENRHGLVGNMGFGHVRTQEQLPGKGFASVGYFGADDGIMVKPAIEWMKARKNGKEPFFVGMLTVVSHHPYAVPHKEPDISTPDKAYLAYEMAVHSTDVFLGRLIEEMRSAGLLTNTLIVVTGDHGEGFGEHGPRMHNGTAYEEGMRVPMVLYGPDVLRKTGRLGGLRQHLDLMPTVLDLAGIQVSQPLPGSSLLSGNGHEQIAMQCWYQDYCAVGIDQSGEKLIYWYGKRPLESFDLRDDSAETVNLAEGWGSGERDDKVETVFQKLADLRSVYQ